MSTSRITGTAFSLLSALALVASPALAHGGHGGGGHGGGGHSSGGGAHFSGGGSHFGGGGPHFNGGNFRGATSYHSSAPVHFYGRNSSGYGRGYGYGPRFGAPRYGYGWGVARPFYGWNSRIGFGSEGWRGGRWFHGWMAGRLGWWWMLNDGWYYYNAPIYPYPGVAPTVVAPIDQTPMSYFCRSANGFYPNVQTCPEGWETFQQTEIERTE